MELNKLRYPPREAQELLSLGSTKFWARVKEGALRLQHDGGRRFVTRDELQRYLAACDESSATAAR